MEFSDLRLKYIQNNRYKEESETEESSLNWHLGQNLLVNNFEFVRNRNNRPKKGSALPSINWRNSS